MLLIVFAAFLAVSLVCCLTVRIDRGFGPHVELTPSLITVLALAGYTAALPISRYIFSTSMNGTEVSFIWEQLGAMVGLSAGFIGAMAVGAFRRSSWNARHFVAAERPILLLTLMAACHLLRYGMYLDSFGYSLMGFFSRYGYGERSYDEQTVIATATDVACISCCWLVCGISRWPRHSTSCRLFALSATALLLCVYMLRGNRNEAIIIILPIVVRRLQGSRIQVARLALAALAAWLLLYSVGIVRNVGVEHVDRLRFDVAAYDPMQGELGTMFNIHEKLESASLLDSPLLLGSSYFVDPIVNMMPRQFWRDRPLTVSQIASVLSAGKGYLAEGIGCSPIAEAILNFDWPGVPLIFVVFGVSLPFWERLLSRRGPNVGFSYAILAPMLINFMRCDFATIAKMTFLYISMTCLLRRTTGVYAAARLGHKHGGL